MGDRIEQRSLMIEELKKISEKSQQLNWAHEDIKRVKKYGKIDMATIYNKWLGKGILRMDHEDYLMASKFFSKAWKKFPQNKDPYCL